MRTKKEKISDDKRFSFQLKCRNMGKLMMKIRTNYPMREKTGEAYKIYCKAFYNPPTMDEDMLRIERIYKDLENE